MTANIETLHLPTLASSKELKKYLTQEQVEFQEVLNGQYLVLDGEFTTTDIFIMGKDFQKYLLNRC